VKVGDRVRYHFVGPFGGRGRDGQLGTVIVVHTDRARVKWDDNHAGNYPWCYNLEIIDMLDTTKPLETCMGKATFITETSEGHILVSASGTASKWTIFDKQGNFVRSDTGHGDGLRLSNKVERVVLYQVVASQPKGYILAGAYGTEAEARRTSFDRKQIVRVTSENGKVVSVELVE